MSLVDGFGSEVLGQSRPTGTGTADLYSPATNRRAIITQVVIANTTALAAAASVFCDADGNTKDGTTALMYAKSIAANTSDVTLVFADGIEIPAAGTIGIQAGTADALCFTLLGRELDA